MILGFKEFFDKEKTKPTHFREKILAGVGYVWSNELQKPVKLYQPLEGPTNVSQFIPKITTIRKGHRWKAGDLMHMAYGVRTKNYCQFNKGIPELERVKSVQDIKIKWRKTKFLNILERREVEIFVDDYLLIEACVGDRIVGSTHHYRHVRGAFAYGSLTCDLIAVNDGFDNIHDFLSWFNKDFDGQIIHWTDKRY